jgi:hypothetical protein
MIGRFIGIFISGCFLFLVLDFAFLAIKRIKIPVVPPEMTPPIDRISMNSARSSRVRITYRASGTREVRMKFVLLGVFMSYLKVAWREYERTKYEVNIVKIPRIIMIGPKESVAILVMAVPSVPMKIDENKMYSMIGISEPSIIAFFRSFSWPLISFLSSGIEVNPSRAKRTTPNGRVKFAVFMIVRFVRFMEGIIFMNIPKTIMIIVITPNVSIFFSPFSPLFSRRVMIIQNDIAKNMGEVSPGISFANESPSPIR